MLRAYDEHVPGAARDMVTTFNEEVQHRRRKLERWGARSVIAEVHLGQVLAMIYVLVIVGLIVYAINKDAEWVAAMGMAGAVVGGVTAFLGLRKKVADESEGAE